MDDLLMGSHIAQDGDFDALLLKCRRRHLRLVEKEKWVLWHSNQATSNFRRTDKSPAFAGLERRLPSSCQYLVHP